jgi:uncharacterized protein
MKEVKLDLKQIFEKEKQPYFRAQYEFTPEELKIPADVGDVNTPVKVDVYITKNPRGEGYKVTYSIKGNIELTCSRCLEVFSKDLGGEHTVVAQNGYEERENLRESDLNTYSLEGDTLNLTQLVREQILLDVPYKPLCHPECKGIEVEEKQNQSPFGELKKLLKK